MSDPNHPWCSDVARDKAIRAAEDGRQGPLPTLAEAISRAGQFLPQEALQEQKCTERDSGLRTERVYPEWQRAKWGEALAILHEGGSFGRGNCFSPGTIAALMIWADKEMARLTAERDAAIRERDEARADAEHDVREVLALARKERDAARAEVERLKAKIVVIKGHSRMDMEAEIAVEEAWERCGIAPHWPSDEPGTSHRYAQSMAAEIVRLRFRVAELEGAAAKCTAEPKSSPEPRGWLTVEERVAVDAAADALGDRIDAYKEQDGDRRRIEVLDALLARSTPPRVRRPMRSVDYPHQRDAEWIAAIREAGGEVE